jgi:fumarate hydratase class II
LHGTLAFCPVRLYLFCYIIVDFGRKTVNTRIEHDTMGEVRVPEEAYWGAQTQRSLENFRIGSETMPIEVIRAFAVVKKASAMANAGLGRLAPEKMEAICRVCDEILSGELDAHFPLKVWQTGSGTQTNMNVNEVIANRAHVLKGNLLGEGTPDLHPNDHVNMSQSSNDTFPAAMHIAAVKILAETTLPAVHALADVLDAKALAWKEIVKTGRTHFMDAVPLTLGQEFSGYASMVRAGLRRLEDSMDRLYELALGGTAVGTGLNCPEGFDRAVAQQAADLTGFPFRTAENKFEALSAHDGLVGSHGALRAIAVSLSKIANDIRMLGSGPRCGIGELVLPANEPGSSIMPGKVNPTQAEALTMVCAQVMGNDAGMGIAGAAGQFELNVYKPMIINTFIQSARLLGEGADSFTRNCLAGLAPDRKKIQAHLDNTLMLVTALNPHIGYEKAAGAAKYAHEKGTTLKAAVAALGLMAEDEFDRLVDPSRMTAPLPPQAPGEETP